MASYAGFGDTNWRDIISILRSNGYEDDICIEGYHDPVIQRRTGDDRTAPRTELSEMVQRRRVHTNSMGEIIQIIAVRYLHNGAEQHTEKLKDTGGHSYETWVCYSNP